MSRRRLRLSYSSEEENDENLENTHDRTQDNGEGDQLTTASPQPPPATSLPSPIPAAFSDEEFVDVSDNLTPPSPSNFNLNPAPPPPPAAPVSSDTASGSPLANFLSRMGLRLRGDWLDSCLQGLERSAPRFSTFNLQEQSKLCFEQLLFSDMNHCGAGVLPRDVASMHLVELAGPFVLQVDEIINLSCPLKGRYQEAATGLKRCLKLSLTDGVQRVFGMEYRPIKDLQVLAPAGFKVVISNVQIRHGLLMLLPEVIQVLGGVVEELEEARKRLVSEVNKPPRGRRTRTGVTPSLASRATLAAWSSINNDGSGHVNSSASEIITSLQSNRQGVSFGTPRTNNISQRNINQRPASVNVENAVSQVEDMHIETGSTTRGISVSAPPFCATVLSHVNTPSVHSNGEYATNRQTSSIPDQMQRDSFCEREAASSISCLDSTAAENSVAILSRNEEVPFTYLANLSAKFAAIMDNSPFIRGKIKCFLTGVKKFQYKRRDTYELLCYVDDGSLISEIVIDHSVVQKGIGHSPVAVSTALSSSDPKLVDGMKETLRQFQAFLANFEGTMLIEMNKQSPCPVALEMSQGCSVSDARLLFGRLNSLLRQPPELSRSDPIILSP